MLRDALFVAAKDVRYMLAAKETLLWIFVMPVVFFYFIGTVTSGFGPSGGARGADPIVVARGADPGHLADQLERRLVDRDYELVPAVGADGARPSAPVLTLPDGFTDLVLAGGPARVAYEPLDDDRAGDFERLRILRAVYTLLADVVVAGELGRDPTPEALDELNAAPRSLSVRVEPAGRRKTIPTGYEQTVPGILVMFTLLVLTTSGSALIVIERRQGLLRRLAATPIARRDVVLGKWGGKLALGLVQVGTAMVVGSLPPFRMDWGAHLPAVVAVLVAYAGLMASIGLLLGSVARTEGQAVGIGVLAANALGALGGCWWPIEVTPEWMQRLALTLPTGWAMDALHRLVSFGDGPAAVVPHVAGMALAALAVGWLAVRAFRFD